MLLKQIHSLVSCLQKQPRLARRRFNLCPWVVANVWSPSPPFWLMRTSWLKTIAGAIGFRWPHALQRVKWTFAIVGRSSTWELVASWEAQLCCSTSLQWRTMAERSKLIRFQWQQLLWYKGNTGQQWLLHSWITALKWTDCSIIGSGVVLD